MKKIGFIAVLMIMMLAVFAGCAAPAASQPSSMTEPSAAAEAPAATEAAAATDAAAAVVIKAAGSTSVGPVIEALAELYTATHTNVTINVEQNGSGAGVTACGDGTADLGLASRNLKDEEKTTYPDMQAQVMCLDGVAVIVGAENPVKELTAEQVKGIFLGEITDWSEVGGTAGPITLYSRDSSSGTREAFQTLFLGKDAAGEEIVIDDTLCLIVDSNGAMGTAIEGDVTGIGYMSLGVTPEYKVTAAGIDGVEATVENLSSGTYKYFRNFNILTMGAPAGELASFVEYCMSDPEAIAYMEGKGYIMP